MALHQLIYASRPFGFDESTLAGILVSSRRRNAMNDITGALICRSDIFLQLLEGPEGHVETCFERIEQDDRHVEVRVLVRDSVPQRMFARWAMLHDPHPTRLWTRDEVAEGAPLQASAEQIRSVFRAVAQAAS